tara:strand:- start:76 stop:267 length:192 start_codon:yes stop_codon:yes gene_type:complete
MAIEDIKNYISALEKSVIADIEQLKKMQEANTKFGDMQPVKEGIFKKRRDIAKLREELKNGNK